MIPHMTWSAGVCAPHPAGAAWVSDFDGRAVRIDDADVRADEVERLRELAHAGPDADECDSDCDSGDDLG